MFRFGSKKANRQEYRCSVRFLDDDEAPIDCDFQHMCLGQYVLDFVCSSIGLLEKDLFGLRYVDSHNQRRWLDLSKPVLKQVKGIRNVVFCFRVKYYPPNPLDLKEEACRYQLYLQLKRDLSHGRLNCTQSEAALMVAYIKQAELGDWDMLAVGATPSEDDLDDNLDVGNSLETADCDTRREQLQNLQEQRHIHSFSTSRLLPKHSQEIESRIERIHETLKGISATDAQDLFLKRAASLESYGVDPHPVKDEHNNQLYLGVNHLGVLTFRAGKRDLHVRFDDLVKFNYEGKMFILHVMATGSNRKQVIGFRCPSQAACQHLFACANDIRCYFTSIPPSVSKRNTLSRAMSILKKREISLASLHTGNSAMAIGQAQHQQQQHQQLLLEQQQQQQQQLHTPQDQPEHHPLLGGGSANDLNFSSKTAHQQQTSLPPIGSSHYKQQHHHHHHLHHHPDDDDDPEVVRGGGTSDVGSLLVYSDDDDDDVETRASGGGRNAKLKPPLVTPTVDGTPTRQRQQHNAEGGDADAHHGGVAESVAAATPPNQSAQQRQHINPNGDARGSRVHSGCHGDSTNIYAPTTESPLSEHSDYTLLDCRGVMRGKGSLSNGYPLMRHGQLLALASLVMLLILTFSAIAVMESDSALFEEVKSWPPLVVLRREYYYPVKSFLSGRLRHPLI